MSTTAVHLWCPLYAIGSESDEVAEIPPAVVAKLIALGAAERTSSGSLHLTSYGWKLYRIMESGNDEYVPEFDPPEFEKAYSSDVW